MKTTLIIALILLNQQLLNAQNFLYQQTHKEVEYDYGIIDSAGLQTISEIEKIKYELTYHERTVQKKIDQNYNSVLEITIDSNGYQKSWMDLAKKFRYDENDIQVFNKNDILIKTIPYTSEQLNDLSVRKDQIQANGYHPGLIKFPEFNQQTITQLATQNIGVQNMSTGIVKVTFQDQITTYNKGNLTITREWTDREGYKNKETLGYDPLLNDKGYLQRIKKSERYIHSVKGPCITEVKLQYNLFYNIQDDGHLIDKSVNITEAIQLYPNPNNGVFSVNVQLAENSLILNAHITNIITGTMYNLPVNDQSSFSVNMPDLPSGNYVLQIITNNSSLNTHFFKQ